MIEFIDNLLQVLVTLGCCCISSLFFHRSRERAYFVLASFYGCFTFAGLYWTLFYLLFSETPNIFYVSEVGWLSGCILLYVLQNTVSRQNPMKEFLSILSFLMMNLRNFILNSFGIMFFTGMSWK